MRRRSDLQKIGDLRTIHQNDSGNPEGIQNGLGGVKNTDTPNDLGNNIKRNQKELSALHRSRTNIAPCILVLTMGKEEPNHQQPPRL